MSLKIIRPVDQTELLESALAPTGSAGWKADAISFGVKADDGGVSAVAVFQGFGGGEAEFHFATLTPQLISRRHIEAFMFVAFHKNGLGLSKVWAQINAANTKAIRAALGFGFEFEYRKRAGFLGGDDAIVLSMSSQERGSVPARPQAN